MSKSIKQEAREIVRKRCTELCFPQEGEELLSELLCAWIDKARASAIEDCAKVAEEIETDEDKMPDEREGCCDYENHSSNCHMTIVEKIRSLNK